MALDITRLSGGNTPADGSDPRTFPAIWNATSDALEADVIPTDVTSPATGQLLQYDGTNWVNVGQADAGAIPVFADAAARTTAIPSPTEGMVTYRSDDDVVEVYDGSVFKAVGPGKILQVVQGVKTDQFTTTSTSYTDITGLSVSITPSSASSKILLLADVKASVGEETNGVIAFIQFSGGNSGNYVGDVDSSRTRAAASTARTDTSTGTVPRRNSAPLTANYLDSPATTSAITYKIQAKTGGSGTAVFNRMGSHGDSAEFGVYPSSITAIEIAG